MQVSATRELEGHGPGERRNVSLAFLPFQSFGLEGSVRILRCLSKFLLGRAVSSLRSSIIYYKWVLAQPLNVTLFTVYFLVSAKASKYTFGYARHKKGKLSVLNPRSSLGILPFTQMALVGIPTLITQDGSHTV